jgi:hypothetical protein
MTKPKRDRELERLEQLPMQVLPFLRAVGITPAIRVALAVYGYTPAVHDEGWNLLKASCSGDEDAVPDRSDAIARGAIRTVDDRDEDLFRLVRVSLEHRHPAQASFVLDGIGPEVGIEAVLAVAHLLDRLDALESSPARASTRAEDHAALATLAARTIDRERRRELRALVNTGQIGAPTVDAVGGAAPSAPAAEAAPDERHAALRALRNWHHEWSTIARSCIKRRDQLVRLGLAARRARE